MTNCNNHSPIVCDLDGTLIRTDLTQEAVISLIWHSPFTILYALWILIRQGRLSFKLYLSKHWQPCVTTLPYRDDICIQLRKRVGKQHLVLASASPQVWVDAIGHHLGIFDQCIGSTQGHDLKGIAKLQWVHTHVGMDFVYLGDSAADIPLFETSTQSFCYKKSNHVRSTCPKTTFMFEVYTLKQKLVTLQRAIRPHHWLKNLLILLPALTGWGLYPQSFIADCLIAVVAFCFVVSGVYIANDLSDLNSDRAHPRKRVRPFASGMLSIPQGITLALTCLTLGSSIALYLGGAVFAWFLGYIFLNIAYTTVLKEKALLDVAVLTSFYMIRIFIGIAILHVPSSFWFVSFLTCFFTQFAFLKRYIETRQVGKNVRRNYTADDSSILMCFGVGFAFTANLLLALYTQSPQISPVYHHPYALLLLPALLLFFTLHLWLEASRNLLHDDPLVHVIRTPISWVIGFLIIAVLCFARFQ